MSFIDYRKNKQSISINGNDVYIWLYKNKNYIAYGINGTSFHKTIDDYKTKEKSNILNIIMKNTYDFIKESRG